MLEITCDGEQLQIVYLGCRSGSLPPPGKKKRVFMLQKWRLHLQNVGSKPRSAPPKITVSSEAHLRFFPVTPSRPHCPCFLNPSSHICFQILQLYLFCVFLHLLDYSAEHSTPERRWTQSEESLVLFFFFICSAFLYKKKKLVFKKSVFLVPSSLECICRAYDLI